MRDMIGMKYIVTVGNGWFDEGTHLEIIDHRLSRTIIEKFESDEREYQACYDDDECPSSQTTYQYKFVLRVQHDKDTWYSAYNDMIFLDFLSEYCEELDKEAEF
jgi:hypothetical protein